MNRTEINHKSKHLKALTIVGIVLVIVANVNAYAGVQSVKVTQEGTQITFTDNTDHWLEY